MIRERNIPAGDGNARYLRLIFQLGRETEWKRPCATSLPRAGELKRAQQGIEKQLPEACVILGEVIECWLSQYVRRTILYGRAVEIDWATRTEVDRSGREKPVEIVDHISPRAAVVSRPADRQLVRREVALLIDVHVEHLRIRGAQSSLYDRKSDDAGTAVNHRFR